MANLSKSSINLADGTVYSKRKNHRPLSIPSLEDYTSVVGEEKMERLYKIAERLKGLKLMELNATSQGGGVAEMLYSSIPFLDALGVEAEWKIIHGEQEYFECTKELHNLLQGKKGSFTPQMEKIYFDNLEKCASTNLIDYNPDVVVIHDPQPMGLSHFLKKPDEIWLWRCHIDIEEESLVANPSLWGFITQWHEYYNSAIFSAAHYIVSRWPLPKFIIPPFIDPISEKNRELSEDEINKVLTKYQIDPRIPIIAQVGRFDPWKGIDRTIAAFRLVREAMKCQLIIAGGMASDDPEGARILEDILNETRNDEDIHILNLSIENRQENHREVNALQRAANVVMQPSTREGFGLVVTEALWKSKPVIAADVGAIPLQIRDGDTGFFYKTPRKTADRVLNLLNNPRDAEKIGQSGRQYVKEHFLMPDRVADWLMTIYLNINWHVNKEFCRDSIISFHPWYKLSKREKYY